MPLTAKEQGGDFPEREPIPEGMHQAVCYAIYDIGHQYSERYENFSHKCIICWEIPSLRIEFEKDGKTTEGPQAISNFYTISLGEKSNLRKILTSWRGRAFTAEELDGFDMGNVLGAACNLQIVHNKSQANGKTYSNVNGVIPLMKGQEKLACENTTRYFVIEDHGAGNTPPEWIPKWIAEKIMDSKEYKDVFETTVSSGISDHAPEPSGLDDTEDSPF